MSGGTFSYHEHTLYEIAQAIEMEVYKNRKYSDHPISDDTRKRVLKIAMQLHKLYKQVHAIDYFFAGDIGEDRLLEALKGK